MDSLIQVNGSAWPTAALGGVKITNRYMLADADRTQEGMHFELLGEVWEVAITFPNLTSAEYQQIYSALQPFVVNVSLYNPWLGRRMTIECYRTDLELTRKTERINEPITISLIGTEIN